MRKGHFKLDQATRVPTAAAGRRPRIAATRKATPIRSTRPKGLFKHNGKGWHFVKYGVSGVGYSKPRLPLSTRQDLKLRCR